MNVTLLAAVAMLAAWLVLVFALQVASGLPHVLLALGVVLLARRVLVGAPRFRS